VMSRRLQAKTVVLVTGPPGNGRDEYLREALPRLRDCAKVGYHHVFEYMQRAAPSHDVPNLTRENVFDVAKSTLERIRDHAFADVADEIRKSDNQIEIVSTPAVFKVTPWGDYLSGRVDGVTINHMNQINPTHIIVFIDDLLRVREQMKRDPLRRRMRLTLKDLAEWRHLAIDIVQEYIEQRVPPVDWIIFAKEHPVLTFADLVLGQKPRLYLSYHITGQHEFADIERFMNKLGSSFVCIDPLAIKDWDIVKAYDNALQTSIKGQIPITVNYRSGSQVFTDISLEEIEDAIDLIRTQIVERDFHLIANVHATVVYHKDERPSYGVMSEVIHSVTRVNRPVYVLYPFKTRPSPFFEHFVKRENVVYGDETGLNSLEDEMLERLKRDYQSWPTWRTLT